MTWGTGASRYGRVPVITVLLQARNGALGV